MITELTTAAATARRLNALLRASLDLETFNIVVFELTKLNLDLMAAQSAALEAVAFHQAAANRIRELEEQLREYQPDPTKPPIAHPLPHTKHPSDPYSL